MITATIEVMKNSRPKYSTAITTPIATTGNARCRASCTALTVSAVSLRGLLATVTDANDPRLECSTRVIMKLICTPPRTRILALDLGKKRIGMAISDPLGISAQGLPNLDRTNKRADLAALERIVREREVGLILMGNPINMGGKEGRQSAWVREFAGDLEKRTGLPVKCGMSG